MKTLWTQADTDGSGEIDFEEFVVFYRKYFDSGGDACPFEEFYAKVAQAGRRSSAAQFDTDFDSGSDF